MNLPRYSLENKKVIYFFLVVMMIGGIIAFAKLAKKEDSPFVIKTAVLITQYPGATPQEVEELVTEPIEREIQSMSEVKQIESESRFGLSKITIELIPSIDNARMPVKWDELRRKVANVQAQLPPEASVISVNDDFGDVFGIYYALTIDEGFSYKELREWTQKIKKLLIPIPGVQKVSLFGEQTEIINVKISPEKLTIAGINPNELAQLLSAQNTLVNTGEVAIGEYRLRIMADGTYQSIDDIRNQLFITHAGQEIRLGDIADVERGYLDPPSNLMHVNGLRAVGIGVASGAKDNVVAVGDAVAAKLEEIKSQLPVGIELTAIYPENEIAAEANNGFILNLIESLLIVIAIIFIVMGARAGWLIGSSLLFSVGGTMLIMLVLGVSLNRTSLAAFIIAMGMLVDNAIVVTDNAQIAIRRGVPRYKALIDGATGPQWQLLGATFIAICSFLPLYLAPSSVAEMVNPLFVVLAVSLGLSWVLALMQTPVFGSFILAENSKGAEADPYDTKLYHKFENILGYLIKHRFITVMTVVSALVFSLYVMGRMPQSFFPTMDKPYMRADLVFPEGYNINKVNEEVKLIEKYLSQQPEIKNYSITMGGSPVRYYLASASYGPMPNYANVLIETNESEQSVVIEQRFYDYMVATYPDIITRSALFALSPVPDAKIEIAFIGDNIDTLAALTQRAMDVAHKCDMVIDVRGSWGNKIPVWKPTFKQEKGLQLGISRQQLANSLRAATNGMPLGSYREGDVTMPILMKASDIDSLSLNDIKTLPVFSTKTAGVQVEQVVDNFTLDYEYNLIKRYDRQRTMMMQCEPARDVNAIAAFNTVYAAVQKEVKLPEGYSMKYFGDQETQSDSNSAIASQLPLTFLLIFVTLLFLFPHYYRRSVVILAMLPLIFIGVVWGLLLGGKSMDFFAMLGLLGLIGMNIKNAIVLVDQIKFNIEAGMESMNAVIDATKTRIVPVTMASGTTILGMLPLLSDRMFGGMAATIMGGLLMATILTIFILPVTYCIFFNIKNRG
ncbi:MAG: efflux RND transporter permease subunit [Alistipes sp.]